MWVIPVSDSRAHKELLTSRADDILGGSSV